MEPTVPAKIGPYVFKGKIGNGAYATVMLCVDVVHNTYVACKVIDKQRLHREEDYKRFESEIRIQQQARHPNIVQIIDLYKDTLNYYVFLEFCSGGELFNYISSHKKLTDQESQRFMVQILDAVLFLHRNKVSHRDLKPENILMDCNGNIKINDFGFSKYCSGKHLFETFCGTPIYCAPEILQGNKYDGRKADMWSLGVILFVMVCGRYPWVDKNPRNLLSKMLACQYHIPKTVSPECDDLIRKLIVVDASLRYTVYEAIGHPFIRSAVKYASTAQTASTLNIKKVDKFFELEKDEEISTPLQRTFSTSQLNYSFGWIMKILDRESITKDEIFQKKHRLPTIKIKKSIKTRSDPNVQYVLKDNIKISAKLRKTSRNANRPEKKHKIIQPMISKVQKCFNYLS